MKINESGRSMIEMLGVLAIIGVLSVGGIAGYSKAMSKYRVNKTVDQVSRTIANTRILYGAQRTYGDLTNTIIDTAKLFPQEMGAADSAQNPFAGDVTMAVADRFKSGDNKAVLLTYKGIPEEACIDIATIDWGTGAGGGLLAFGIDKTAEGGAASETTIKTAIGGYYAGAECPSDQMVCAGETDTVMTVKEATESCSGENNTLYFKFY